MLKLETVFKLADRRSSFKQEMLAGITTFLAMLYSVVVIPGLLKQAGFPPQTAFIAICLVAGFGSLLMGFWANLPLAVGCSVSLTAYVTYSIVLNQHISLGATLGAVFLMGLIFTFISITGMRTWLLRSIPAGIARGTGIGIGLFLLLMATNNVGLVIKNPLAGLPITLGAFTSFPAIMSILGLAAIMGLEKRRFPGGILLVIVLISLIGLIFDPHVHYHGIIAWPTFNLHGSSSFFDMDIKAALQPAVFPSVLALVLTAIFDATGTIRGVIATQTNLTDKNHKIINESKALTSDSLTSIFASLVGASPAAVYIESAAGIAAGGKTGLTAIVVGLLFLLTLFISPLASLVPLYATAPALMYVGLLMLSSVTQLDFEDLVDALSGLVCAVFIVLTCNIVTGIMLGFVSLTIGRIISGEWNKLNKGTVLITLLLVSFYLSGWTN